MRRFMTHVERSPAACTSSATLLAGLLEAFTERIADVLERVQARPRRRLAHDLPARGRRGARATATCTR
ncbi:MAG: hypothetical protein MZV70_62460 [Desulfobacterales bacterium]|nr:hypothetical protein [Desulfobacterales bacterium]